MTDHIWCLVPDGTFFLTARLQDQGSDLLLRQIGLLRDVTRLCQKRAPFVIDCAVVLPALVHMVWVLPAGDTDVAGRWRMIRSTFARHLPPAGCAGVWRRQMQHHPIRDTTSLALHRHLIATAALQVGPVRRPDNRPDASRFRDHQSNLCASTSSTSSGEAKDWLIPSPA